MSGMHLIKIFVKESFHENTKRIIGTNLLSKNSESNFWISDKKCKKILLVPFEGSNSQYGLEKYGFNKKISDNNIYFELDLQIE